MNFEPVFGTFCIKPNFLFGLNCSDSDNVEARTKREFSNQGYKTSIFGSKKSLDNGIVPKLMDSTVLNGSDGGLPSNYALHRRQVQACPYPLHFFYYESVNAGVSDERREHSIIFVPDVDRSSDCALPFIQSSFGFSIAVLSKSADSSIEESSIEESSIEELVNEIGHLRQEIITSKLATSVSIIGQGIGGTAACIYAAQNPEKVASIVAIDPISSYQEELAEYKEVHWWSPDSHLSKRMKKLKIPEDFEMSSNFPPNVKLTTPLAVYTQQRAKQGNGILSRHEGMTKKRVTVPSRKFSKLSMSGDELRVERIASIFDWIALQAAKKPSLTFVCPGQSLEFPLVPPEDQTESMNSFSNKQQQSSQKSPSSSAGKVSSPGSPKSQSPKCRACCGNFPQSKYTPTWQPIASIGKNQEKLKENEDGSSFFRWEYAFILTGIALLASVIRPGFQGMEKDMNSKVG